MNDSSDDFSLDARSLHLAYAEGTLSPTAVIESVFRRIDRSAGAGIWIHLEPRESVLAAAAAAERRRAAGEHLPLFGLPFAVKDNIDVAGLPTTAGCPAYAYTAATSATVVRRLLAAGAVLVGKTNLDQFATGLVGVRSPYGIAPNPFDARVIPGGSSSGSAVAVSMGLVTFALGTDTAGSGRVPASLNNVVGLKPSRGLLSTSGVVPACRSLDCVSIFALTVDDASDVAGAAKGYDADDIYSRPDADQVDMAPGVFAVGFRFGIPAEKDLTFYGDEQASARFVAAVARLVALGGEPVEIDFQPFLEAGRLLYEGPWVAERLATFQGFLNDHAGDVLEVTRDILLGAAGHDAVSAFRAQYRLEELRRATEAEWRRMDFLLVPSTPTHYTIAEVLADPRQLNTKLGHYTSFVNLLDLAALAIPNGFRGDRMPSGVTLIGPRSSDGALATIGAAYHHDVSSELGATWHPIPPPAPRASPRRGVHLVVVGAHLTGLPLNHELVNAGARLVRSARTAPLYRLFALPETTPAKPGMVRLSGDGGAAIEVEVWDMPPAAFGAFVAKVPSPLCIGSIVLEDGTSGNGFLCESFAVANALDISGFGGWRAYLRALDEHSH